MSEPASSLGISTDEFNLWRHHPVSKIFLKYAADFASILEREALDRWRSGTLKLVDEQEMRGRVLTLREIVELQFEAIDQFYQQDQKEEEA